MDRSVFKVAALLFGSGACALVYQVAWLRELRLIFGASTAANAAVLAIFMGGLGVGSAWLGRRVDRAERPLGMYANLELGVALGAAITPALVWLVRAIYVGVGGSPVLGTFGSTVVRLLLAALVLAGPTILMGGTLPAAARAVEKPGDGRRRAVALLYGANALGAVLGAFASTFLLLEVFGVRFTLWMACLINALVAVIARAYARSLPPVPAAGSAAAAAEEEPAPAGAPPPAPRLFVLAASGIVGFAFFLLELVWYRMLGPLLGGSSYTFGLILVIALLGIAIGGALYSIVGAQRPATLQGFAMTCALEALLVIVPYALGDRLALLALLLRPLGAVGFIGHVGGWSLVAGLVTLPTAIVAGYQFPMLISLLGKGRAGVGRDVGLAYTCNTVGAITGSLAGGFGLLTLLSATGTWRAVAAVLIGVGAAAAAIELRRLGPAALPRQGRILVAGGLMVMSLGLFAARGPTAAWRHTPIGAGRADSVAVGATRNGLIDWMRTARRYTKWEQDGAESGVAMSNRNGTAFIVNGKSDGDARSDAGTQVLSGLIGALFHPDPRRAFVIGLGTGSTAGWLGKVPQMERVDVIELEPAILEVARACVPVNQAVLDNPRVKVTLGDAREVLLTTPERYDLIFSEPSNPYRAGISSLFTREFYEAATSRLAPGGYFMQWLQAYEVDAAAIRSAYATLAAVFPSVQTWQTQSGDLILVATAQQPIIEAEAVRARLQQEPYKSAFGSVWRVSDLEGVLGHFLGGDAMARALAKESGGIFNSDDQNWLEFALARSVGAGLLVDSRDLLALSRGLRADRPVVHGEVDWGSVDEQRRVARALFGPGPERSAPKNEDARRRADAMLRFAAGDAPGALAAWRTQPRPPTTMLELEMAAEGAAVTGAEDAEVLIERVRAFQPTQADVYLASAHLVRGNTKGAAAALDSAFQRYRQDPWPRPEVMGRAVTMATEVARRDAQVARGLLETLRTPFSVDLLHHDRLKAITSLAFAIDFAGMCKEALRAFEPETPWQQNFLERRVACYQETKDPLLPVAEAELEQFLRWAPTPLVADLPPRGDSGNDLVGPAGGDQGRGVAAPPPAAPGIAAPAVDAGVVDAPAEDGARSPSSAAPAASSAAPPPGAGP